jgi:uncharacterized membrane protein YdjX (TVP38/TMEM64 family)
MLLLKGVDIVAVGNKGMAAIRDAGPWAFFGAAVVLPVFGAPLTPFTIVSGEAFAPRMTLPGAMAAMLLAIAGNQALTYWMARYALRPVLSALAARYGYSVPALTKGNELSAILFFRLTPGIPFFVQSYVLGLARVPFVLYMVASWLANLPMAVGAIVLGKGVFNGNFRMVVVGLSVLAATIVSVHWIRRRYVRKPG